MSLGLILQQYLRMEGVPDDKMFDYHEITFEQYMTNLQELQDTLKSEVSDLEKQIQNIDFMQTQNVMRYVITPQGKYMAIDMGKKRLGYDTSSQKK